MATYFIPSGVPVKFDVSGDPAASYILRCFLTGTSTPATMYADNAGTSAGTTITLDSEGYISTSGTRHPVWLDSVSSYDLDLRDPTNTSTIIAFDNMSTGPSFFQSGWTDYSDVPTFVSFASGLLTFTVPGNQSANYPKWRWLKVSGTGFTDAIGAVASVAYVTVTTITMYVESGVTPDATINEVLAGPTINPMVDVTHVGHPILATEILSGAVVVTNVEYYYDDFRRYGVTYDGVTDYITELQNAIDCCKARGGGELFLLAGTIMKSGALTLKEKVYIRGAGMYSTAIQNTGANINGVFMEAEAGTLRGGGMKNIGLVGNASDTTNEGLHFDPTDGFGMGRFENVKTKYFNKGIAGGDEMWELKFIQFRMDQPISYGVYIVGTAGTGSDNVFEKVYVNNVGNGTSGGRSFQLQTGFNKSIMLNCTWGDTSSTDTQLRIEGVKGLEIISGNVEGFDLANGKSAIETTSDTVVSIRGLAFQAINGPGSGSAHIINATGTSTVNVNGCYEFSGATGTIYALASANTAVINHYGNFWTSTIEDSAVPSGSAINFLGSQIIIMSNTVFDLSAGSPETEYFAYIPNRWGNLVAAYLIYEEASSADAGIRVAIGYPSDDDFLASVTTGTGQAAGSVQAMTINDTRIGGYNETIKITNDGAKTGAGTVRVQMVFTVTQ